MPECHKCKRVLPRSELRSTKLGYVCLEGGELGKFSRCWQIARTLGKQARAIARSTERRAA